MSRPEKHESYLPDRLTRLVSDLLDLTVRAREALADGDSWLAEAALEELEVRLVGAKEAALEFASLLLEEPAR